LDHLIYRIGAGQIKVRGCARVSGPTVDRITTHKKTSGVRFARIVDSMTTTRNQSFTNVLRAVPSFVAKSMKIGDLELDPRLRHVVPDREREDERAELCCARLLIL
jgi:hypothetical protein